jgi:hypothetical protein
MATVTENAIADRGSTVGRDQKIEFGREGCSCFEGIRA